MAPYDRIGVHNTIAPHAIGDVLPSSSVKSVPLGTSADHDLSAQLIKANLLRCLHIRCQSPALYSFDKATILSIAC